MARHLWINLPNSYTFLVPVPKGFNFHGIFWNFFARSVGSLGNNLVVRRTVGPKVKEPAQSKFDLKIVKLTDHTYACNSLTNFEYNTHPLKRK